MEDIFPLHESIPYIGYSKRIFKKLIPVLIISIILIPAFLFVLNGNFILSSLLFLFILIFFYARYRKFGRYYIYEIQTNKEQLIFKMYDKDMEVPEVSVSKHDLQVTIEPTGERGKTGNKLVLKSDTEILAEQYQVGNWNLEKLRFIFKKLKEWKQEALQPHESHFLE